MKIRNKPICRWLAGILAAALLLVPAGFAQATEALDQTGTVTNSEIKKLAAGENHTVALKTDGTVWTWGNNSFGQLGYTGSGASPKQVIDPVTNAPLLAMDVGAGSGYTVVLLTNGTVWAWGSNLHGTLGNGSTPSSSPTPVMVHTSVGPLTGITSISAGYTHVLALKSDKTAWAWGDNDDGEIGNGVTGTDAYYATQVSTTSSTFLNNVKSITAGNQFSMAITNDNTLYTWGSTVYGEIGRITGDHTYAEPLADIGQVSRVFAGSEADTTFAVTVTGTVYGWGTNGSAQLGIGSSVKQSIPTKVPALTEKAAHIVTMSVGTAHAVAVFDDGSLWGAGESWNSQLAITPDTTPLFAFRQLPPSGVAGVIAGSKFTFILKTDGKVYGFGNNTYDQLGTGTGSTSATPTAVLPLTPPPPVVPENLKFTDTDLSAHQIRGTLTWTLPADATGVTGFKVYFMYGSDKVAPVAGTYTKNGDVYQWNIPANTLIEGYEGYEYKIGVFCMSGETESSSGASKWFYDTMPGEDWEYRHMLKHQIDPNGQGVNIAKILAYLKTAPDKDIDGSGVYDAADVQYLLRLIDTIYVPDYTEYPV